MAPPLPALLVAPGAAALVVVPECCSDATVALPIATTAAVMGSYYNTLPGGCVTVVRIGINYSRCGSVWYQPVYSGANVRYQVVVEP